MPIELVESDDANRECYTDLFNAVHGFMEAAGQSTGKFHARQATLYTGLVLEEVGEMIEVIMRGCVTDAQQAHLGILHNTLRRYAKEFRDGYHMGDILRCNHADLIDAQFDTAWVAVGALISTSPNAPGKPTAANEPNEGENT